ncbi:UPF0688 protein C1orf174 homolog [Parambassis ranga]|uniref:UPF0688 protein C1orf174 homolog n=1 Tax=Parambassis ranga TaxID=210632 RepID=A0A6P7IE22_9TELE|nr:UPF0688 protein C1orf174 homolog [Parambassis ranga]
MLGHNITPSKMPGQLDNLKPRKRKSSSEVRLSKKVSGTGRRCTKTHLAAESNSVVSVYGKTETQSRISCECHQSSYERRCSASPGLEGHEEKENKLRPDIGSLWDQPEPMDCDEFGKNIFPDEDSNQILPVEQFFGNLDALQDFPQRSSSSAHVHRGTRRRRHYYARDDSDEEEEEEGLSSSFGAEN